MAESGPLTTSPDTLLTSTLRTGRVIPGADRGRSRHGATFASELATLAIALALQDESKRAIEIAEEAVGLLPR